MEGNQGKLFIGGISWETNKDRLRDYFQTFGEVVEAVIMKDRATGRARGFGFIVFADPLVADRVVREKHMLDGRMVEAKKAVPRDDQPVLNRSSSNSVHGSSPPSTLTKKIFVGGLASTVTEDDLRMYFEQYGTITDAVVMYDHNTQRPRGFGFITYDSEDSVDKALLKTFHELNGKMVEVKRAIPKELSPGPNIRSPIGGYSYALNKFNNFLNAYGQGYNPNSIGSYGIRMDSGIGLTSGGRNGFPSYGGGYGMGVNLNPHMSLNYGGNPNYNSNFGYIRGLGPYYGANPNRYAASTGGYSGGNMETSSIISPMSRNLWGNVGLNCTINTTNPSNYLSSGNGNLEAFAKDTNLSWGSSPPLTSHGLVDGSGYANRNISFGRDDNGFSSSTAGILRNIGTALSTSFPASSMEYDEENAHIYNSRSLYSDSMWRSGSSDIDRPGPFSYGLGNAASNVTTKGALAFAGAYDIMGRQPNREG